MLRVCSTSVSSSSYTPFPYSSCLIKVSFPPRGVNAAYVPDGPYRESACLWLIHATIGRIGPVTVRFTFQHSVTVRLQHQQRLSIRLTEDNILLDFSLCHANSLQYRW